MTVNEFVTVSSAVLAIVATGVSIRQTRIAADAKRLAERATAAAERATEDARRVRLDQLGPSVVVEVHALRGRWVSGWLGLPDAPPGVASPGREFSSPGQDEVLLLLGVHVAVRNEGQRTATVQFGANRVDAAGQHPDDDDTEAALAPPGHRPNPHIPGKYVDLLPGEAKGVVVRIGHTLSELIQQGSPQVVETVVSIGAWTKSETDGSRQLWRLDVDGPIIRRAVGNVSTFVVGAHTPPTTILIPQPREYPEPAPGGWEPPPIELS